MAGLASPFPYSLRQLDDAARLKRREEWNRVAAIRYDLRRLLAKGGDKLEPVDFNPTFSEEERAKIKAESRRRRRERAPEITGEELFEILRGSK